MSHFSLESWIEITKSGTSGDQVHDILRDWKNNQEFLKSCLEQVEDQRNQAGAELVILTNLAKSLEGQLRAANDEIEDIHGELMAAEQKIEELNNTFRHVMSEECPTDEKHCTCVPFLKSNIIQMKHVGANYIQLMKALVYAARKDMPYKELSDLEEQWNILIEDIPDDPQLICQRFISVEDRMPEIETTDVGGEYIVFIGFPYDRVAAMNWSENYGFFTGGWGKAIHEWKNITHWMPLPKFEVK